MTLTRVAIPSPNYSTRNPAGVRLLVVHTAEGSRTYTSLGAYFANPAVDVSSHAGIDDTPNTIGVYVRRQDNAWTQAGANGVSVSAELCGFAAWDPAEWHRHPNMLASCAAWLREEAAAFGLPLVALSAAAAQSSGRGACQHVDLGAWGGAHADCGPGFPFSEVLAMAGATAPGPGPGPSPSEVLDMPSLTDPVTGGIWVADPKSTPPGAIYTYDGAPYLGATNNSKMNAQGFPLAGIALNPDSRGGGYVLVLDFGSAGEAGGGDRYRRYRFPRNGSGKP